MNDKFDALVQLVPSRTDADLAADLKRRTLEALGPVIDVLNEAKRAGFMINFGIDDGSQRADGSRAVIMFSIAKHF